MKGERLSDPLYLSLLIIANESKINDSKDIHLSILKGEDLLNRDLGGILIRISVTENGIEYVRYEIEITPNMGYETRELTDARTAETTITPPGERALNAA